MKLGEKRMKIMWSYCEDGSEMNGTRLNRLSVAQTFWHRVVYNKARGKEAFFFFSLYLLLSRFQAWPYAWAYKIIRSTRRTYSWSDCWSRYHFSITSTRSCQDSSTRYSKTPDTCCLANAWGFCNQWREWEMLHESEIRCVSFSGSPNLKEGIKLFTEVSHRTLSEIHWAGRCILFAMIKRRSA